MQLTATTGLNITQNDLIDKVSGLHNFIGYEYVVIFGGSYILLRIYLSKKLLESPASTKAL